MSACSAATSGARSKFRDVVCELPFADDGKPVTCQGCGGQASAELAWAQYFPQYESSQLVGKKPKGRVCKPCTLTFQSSGMDAQYSSIGEFFRFGSSPSGRVALQEFLIKRKAIIEHGCERLGNKSRTTSIPLCFSCSAMAPTRKDSSGVAQAATLQLKELNMRSAKIGLWDIGLWDIGSP